MSLVDMTSDLTSIKYGRDRRGGGNSGQPYFTKDIPQRLQSINFANSFLGNDFLVRGGVRSVSAVLEDEIRLSKWFSSLRSADGLLFIAKQNILNKQRPLTGAAPDRFYTPANTLLQAAVNPIGLHFAKEGIIPKIDDIDKYEKLTKTKYNSNKFGVENTNKLLLLYETNIIPQTSFTDTTLQFSPGIGQGFTLYNSAGLIADLNQGLNQLRQDSLNYSGFKGNLERFGISENRSLLFSYQGGPNTLISGKTTVRRVFDTNEGFVNNKNKKYPLEANQYLVYSPGMVINASRVGATFSTGFGDSGIKNFGFELNKDENNDQTGVAKNRRKQLIGDPVNYQQFNRTTSEGNPGKGGRDRSVYYTTNLKDEDLTPKDANGLEIFQPDKITAQSLYSSNSPKNNGGLTDHIKLHIGVLDLDSTGDFKTHTWIHLRAALTNFNDNYQGNWNEFSYMGRGNKFYKYGGYTRNLTMGLDVVVSSKYEQAFVYDKLNYLASVMAPNYSNVGHMRGNIIQLTVGDYLNNVYGILTSLSYNIPNESPWDIGKKNDGSADTKNSLQLPHYIQISNFAFTPIHSFRDGTVPISYVNGVDNSPSTDYISLGDANQGYGTTYATRQSLSTTKAETST